MLKEYKTYHFLPVVVAVGLFAFDVKAIGSAITKTIIMTNKMTDDTITMGLNHLDCKMEALFSSLFVLKRKKKSHRSCHYSRIFDLAKRLSIFSLPIFVVLLCPDVFFRFHGTFIYVLCV